MSNITKYNRKIVTGLLVLLFLIVPMAIHGNGIPIEALDNRNSGVEGSEATLGIEFYQQQTDMVTSINLAEFNETTANAGDNVKFHATVSANSSVNRLVAKLVGETGNYYKTLNMYWDDAASVFSATFEINQYWTQTIHIAEITVISAYYETFYNETDFPTPVLTLSGVTPDTEAPVVHGIWTNLDGNIIDVTQDNLRLSVNVSDTYDMGLLSASFAFTNGTLFDTQIEYGQSCEIRDGREYCVKLIQLYFNEFKDSGMIYLSEVGIYDQLGNSVTLTNGTDYNTTDFTFELTGRIVDNEAPVITGTYFVYSYGTYQTDNFDTIDEAYYGDEYLMYFLLDLDYGLAPTQYVSISYTMNGEYFSPDSIGGTSMERGYNDLWSSSIKISEDSFRGEGLVEINTITVEDRAGNRQTYTGDEMDFPSFYLMNSTRRDGGFISALSIPENVENGSNLEIIATVMHTYEIDFEGVNLSASLIHNNIEIGHNEIHDLDFVDKANNTILSYQVEISGDYSIEYTITDDIGRNWTTVASFHVNITEAIPDDPINSPDKNSEDTTPASISFLWILVPIVVITPILRKKSVN